MSRTRSFNLWDLEERIEDLEEKVTEGGLTPEQEEKIDDAAVMENLASDFSVETNYEAGDMVINDGKFCYFPVEHQAGELQPGELVETNVAEQIEMNKTEPYTLPIAGASTLGGVKVGNGLEINASGVLSASGGSGAKTLTGDNSTLSKILQNCVTALPNGGTLEVFIPRLVYTLKSSDIMQYGGTKVTDGTTEAVATLKVYPLVDGKWVETVLNQYSNINIDTTKFVTNGGNCKALFAKIVQGAEIVLTNCVLRVNVNTHSTITMWALYTNGDVFARSVSGTGDGIYAVTTNLSYPTAATPNGLLTGVRQVPYKQYLTRHNGGMVTERGTYYSGSFMAGASETTGASTYGGYLYKASWGNQYNGCVDDILDIAKYTGASQYVGGFVGKSNGLLYTYNNNDAAAYDSFEGVDLQPAIEEWVFPNGGSHDIVCVAYPTD